MIVRLKKEKPHWGARKIRELLVRRLNGDVRIPAKSTVQAVLDRHGLVKRGRHIKRLVDLGRDPLEQRHGDRHAPTVADLAKRYLSEHAARKAARSYADEQSMFKKLILPRIGRMKVADVKPADMDRLYSELSRRAPIRANRILQVLRKMFNLAIRWEYCQDNPVKGLQMNPEQPRHRYLGKEEIERLIGALKEHPNSAAPMSSGFSFSPAPGAAKP